MRRNLAPGCISSEPTFAGLRKNKKKKKVPKKGARKKRKRGFFWQSLTSLEMQPGAKLRRISRGHYFAATRFRLRILRRTRSFPGRMSAGSLSGRIESIWEKPSKERASTQVPLLFTFLPRQAAEPPQSPGSLLCVRHLHSPPGPCYMCYMCYMGLTRQAAEPPRAILFRTRENLYYMCYIGHLAHREWRFSGSPCKSHIAHIAHIARIRWRVEVQWLAL